MMLSWVSPDARAVHVIVQNTRDSGWRLKPRLRATPQSLPPQAAERAPTGHLVGVSLQPATAGFAVNPSGAVSTACAPQRAVLCNC